MMPDTESRDERYARQTGEQFRELGRFVQAFEQLVMTVRQSCLFLLPQKTPADQQLLNVLLYHQAMTAMSLFECMRALYVEVLANASEQTQKNNIEILKAILHQCAKQYGELVTLRNSMLHGTWGIGFANPADEDFSSMGHFKGKVTASGTKFESAVANAQELSAISARCGDLERFLRQLMTAFIIARPRGTLALGKYFLRNKDGQWSTP